MGHNHRRLYDVNLNHHGAGGGSPVVQAGCPYLVIVYFSRVLALRLLGYKNRRSYMLMLSQTMLLRMALITLLFSRAVLDLQPPQRESK